MKHYTLFEIGEVVEPYGNTGRRRRLILTETDEALTDTPGILGEVVADRDRPFVGPVMRSKTIPDSPEELVRGAMLLCDREDMRCWVLPITGDVDVEVPEV